MRLLVRALALASALSCAFVPSSVRAADPTQTFLNYVNQNVVPNRAQKINGTILNTSFNYIYAIFTTLGTWNPTTGAFTINASTIPLPSNSTLGGIFAATAPTHQYQIGVATNGTPIFAQPSFGDISGTVSSAQLAAGAAAANLATSAGSTRGQLYEYGASGIAGIVPATSGYVLTSNGPGADPSYKPAPSLLGLGVGDDTTFSDGVIGSGNLSNLASASATFTLGDVGKTIVVRGAGSSGSLVTTISGFVDSHDVTLATPGVAVSGAQYTYGTDNYPIIQAALNACTNAGGGTVYVGSSRYLIAGGNLVVSDNCTLSGLGLQDSAIDYVQDYTAYKPALDFMPKRTILVAGKIQNLTLLNNGAFTSNPAVFADYYNQTLHYGPTIADGTANNSIAVTTNGDGAGHSTFAWTNHGFAVNSPVVLGGSLPSPLNVNQLYFVSPTNFTANSFELSPGFVGNTPVETTSSGTISVSSAILGLYLGPINDAPAGNGDYPGFTPAAEGLNILGMNYGQYSYYAPRLTMNNVRIDANYCSWILAAYDFTNINQFECSNFSNATAAAAADITYNVSNAVNNGSGVCRVTVPANSIQNGWVVWAAGIGGASECNGKWTATVVNSTTIDLAGSTFGNIVVTANYNSKTIYPSNSPNLTGINIGQTVTGTNIPGGTTVVGTDVLRGAVFISAAPTAACINCTVTFGVSAFTSGGQVSSTAYWRPGWGIFWSDATGGICNSCFINVHHQGFVVSDGPQGAGQYNFTCVACKIDSDPFILERDAIGVQIFGHSGDIQIDSAAIATVGIGYDIEQAAAMPGITITGGIVRSYNVMWDISGGGAVTIGNVENLSTNTGWIQASLSSFRVSGFIGPNVTFSYDSTPPDPAYRVDCMTNHLLAGYVNNSACP